MESWRISMVGTLKLSKKAQNISLRVDKVFMKFNVLLNFKSVLAPVVFMP